MLEGIICPACENSIDEIDLKDSLKCPHCNNDLKDRKYLDFLEFLMAIGIVENLDFFDQEVYSDDVDDLDQTKEEEVDPAEFEKKRDLFNIYENELHPKNIEENEGIQDYTQFDGINDDIEHIKALVRICKILPCKVNFIEYNPTGNETFRQCKIEKLHLYQRQLTSEGIINTFRISRGRDIKAACGQLVNSNKFAL